MAPNITFEKILPKEDILKMLNNIVFRGVYDSEGNPLRPYEGAKFSMVKILPPERPTSFPRIMHNFQQHPLFTAQPTIYADQTEIMDNVDNFLKTIDKRIFNIGFEGVQYYWEGRGRFHIIPPIIEKHVYPLKDGFLDFEKMSKRFEGAFVKDAKGELHPLFEKVIRDFYIDHGSKVSYMNVFHHNAELINYGLRFNGNHEFFIICDGSHRIDFALEHLDEPTNAIVVESDNLLPYYAFPMPFRPVTRLTSKKAERMYPRLERDKVHLLNSFIKKVLHYDWVKGGLHVSSLRNKKFQPW
ncbi:hypothetical protein HOC80_05370 [archaeon]|jgi:hypothetical protein|nr:hypothetical protein [archaeon]MBT4417502.1 hypothetical protein [archaeon]